MGSLDTLRAGCRLLAVALALAVAACGGGGSNNNDTNNTLADVTFANGQFVTAGKSGRLFTSSNGIKFESRHSNVEDTLALNGCWAARGSSSSSGTTARSSARPTASPGRPSPPG